jgi:hypothetical protein
MTIEFKDKNNNSYSFANYMEFASYWFNCSHRYLKAVLDQKTFNKLNRLAVSSKEARTRMY